MEPVESDEKSLTAINEPLSTVLKTELLGVIETAY
jgi:hypothetical protein